MQEKTIFKTSIIVTLLGLSFLFFYAEEVDLKNVARIDSELPEESVTMQGVVKRVQQSEKVIFLELEGERVETVDVLLFTSEEIYLKEGDFVEVSGTVEEYEGKKEIIANSVKLK